VTRIPRVVLGTAVQDAERRDFTVNSLFLNLSARGGAGALEDLTRRGIADLLAARLSTPLEPLVTFRDDPLRVLRAVRFATRLGFRFDEPLRAAAADATVATDLGSKVSRERIGIELDGALSGPHPIAALRALRALGLARVVFSPPPGCKLGGGLTPLPLPLPIPCAAAPAPLPPIEGIESAALPPEAWLPLGDAVVEALDALLSGSLGEGSSAAALLGEALPPTAPEGAVAGGAAAPLRPARPPLPPGASEPPETAPDRGARLASSADERRVALLAAQLYPLSHATRFTARGRAESLPGIIILESLKRRKKDADDVAALHAGVSALGAAADALAAGGAVDRLALGLALRRDVREFTRPALLLSAAARIAGARAASLSGTLPASEVAGASARALDSHAALLALVREWRLEGCHAWKALLNGGEIKAAFGARAQGPALGVLLEELMRWQLAHGVAGEGAAGGAAAGGAREAALAHLTAALESGAIVLPVPTGRGGGGGGGAAVAAAGGGAQ
jgi:hypothetical protein